MLSLVIVEGTQPIPRPLMSRQGPGLLVHEWGTFTSVAGRDDFALVWRPLTFESDLPSFVYSADKGASWRGYQYPTKSGLAVTVRMETPVLYFYTKQEMAVTVKVDFPGGRITEWYPRALAQRSSIDWGEVTVMPGAQVYLPNDFSENHYYPARETDGAPVRVNIEGKTEHEKFLFYRGVGDFELPLLIRLAEDKVLLTNESEDSLGKVILFENSGGKIGYRLLSMHRGRVQLERPLLDSDLEAVRREIRSMLISNGLFEKEADAMLNTWRNSWFEEGLGVFYILPRKKTDSILPLTISPQPAEIVRVLVGRTELLTPEMEKDVISQIMLLQDPSAGVSEAARKEINKYGRFLESILMEIRRHTTDPQIRTAVNRLLEERE
ncbi:MAG: hypothetical protein ACREBG_03510 [Pyrinomonadaceae bacterium]